LTKLLFIVSDFLGYFSEEYSYSDRLSIVVLPQEMKGELGMKTLQRFVGIYIVGKSVDGLYDLANIRDYVPGNNIKKIISRKLFGAFMQEQVSSWLERVGVNLRRRCCF